RSGAPVLPALFLCGLLLAPRRSLVWFSGIRFFSVRPGIRFRTGFGTRLNIRPGFVRLGGDLARRGFVGPFGRQKRRLRRQWIPHVPLADPVIVAPFYQVEMDM